MGAGAQAANVTHLPQRVSAFLRLLVFHLKRKLTSKELFGGAHILIVLEVDEGDRAAGAADDALRRLGGADVVVERRPRRCQADMRAAGCRAPMRGDQLFRPLHGAEAVGVVQPAIGEKGVQLDQDRQDRH